MIVYRGVKNWFYIELYWRSWELSWWRNAPKWGLQIGPLSIEWS